MKFSNLKIILTSLCIVGTAGFFPAQAADETMAALSGEPDEADLREFIDLVRSDVRTMKTLIISENLPLTNDEAAEFWPLQREYEAALNKLLDERLAMIMKFAPSAEPMTDAQAKELAKTAFDLEGKRTALKRATFARFCEVVPAAKAARFFQIENQLNAAIDLRLAAELPLIE